MLFIECLENKIFILNADGQFKEENASGFDISTLANKQLVFEGNLSSSLKKNSTQNKNIITLNIWELLVFIFPTEFAVNSIYEIAKFLGKDIPNKPLDRLTILHNSVIKVSEYLEKISFKEQNDIVAISKMLGKCKWKWADFILLTLKDKIENNQFSDNYCLDSFRFWKDLPKIDKENKLLRIAKEEGILPDEATAKLKEFLGADAEIREEQIKYTNKISEIFSFIHLEEKKIIIAEAGTGIGKSIAYSTPAVLWAKKNNYPVWISTYTKNLQKQLYSEFSKIYKNPSLKNKKIVVRKGSENYFCILNFAEIIELEFKKSNWQGTELRILLILAIISRWARYTSYGDMIHSDFPSWIADYFNCRNLIGALNDKKGECINAACPHYKVCFIERVMHNAEYADIVISNHALLMSICASEKEEPTSRFKRVIFDEGHHIIDAADGAFAIEFTGEKTYELWRWVYGSETNRAINRYRGLRKRFSNIFFGDHETEKLLSKLLRDLEFLPANNWVDRVKEKNPRGLVEELFCEIFLHVGSSSSASGNLTDKHSYSIECDIKNPPTTLQIIAVELAGEISIAKQTIVKLIDRIDIMLNKLNDDSDSDSSIREHLRFAKEVFRKKLLQNLSDWGDVLSTIISGSKDTKFVDWFCVNKELGEFSDCGIIRYLINSGEEFAKNFLNKSDGVLITSATLAFYDEGGAKKWSDTSVSLGLEHQEAEVSYFNIESPFDYANMSKVFIINDVNNKQIDSVTKAYLDLFTASSGSAMGIFTSIAVLKAVYNKINLPLSSLNIPLYAQHLSSTDLTSLIDKFKHDEKSCLLGTDAIRDGVDVPGNSLRMIVFDKFPWPRRSVLFKERKKFFGADYENSIVRSNLRQAFGRLIRVNSDYGVFVILGSAFPSRYFNAFPEGVEIIKVGLEEAALRIKDFLREKNEHEKNVK